MEPSKRPPPLPMRPAAVGPARTVPPPITRERFSLLPWMALGGSALLLTVVCVAIVWRVLSNSTDPQELAGTSPIVSETPAVSNESTPTPPAVPSAVAPTKPMDTVQPKAEVASSEKVIPATSTAVPEPPVQVPRAEPPHSAFADVIRHKGILELPGRGLMRDSTDAVLAAVPLEVGQTLQLALADYPEIKLNRSMESPDETIWTVAKQAKDAFGGTEEVTLGRFVHREGQLRFQWDTAAPGWTKPASLQFAKLAMTIGNQTQTCQLWKPIVVNPSRLETTMATSVEVPLPSDFVDRPETFHVCYQIAGIDDATLPAVDGALNETVKIVLGQSDDNSIEMELKMTLGDSRSTLQVRLFSSPPHLAKDGEIRQIRQEITPMIVQGHQRQARGKDPKKREIEVDKFRKQIGTLQNQIAAKEAAMDNAAVTMRARYQLDLNNLNNQVSVVESKLSKLESELAAAQQFTEKMTDWCDDVGGLMKKLEEQAQLRYAVFLESEPRTIVVETSDFALTKD